MGGIGELVELLLVPPQLRLLCLEGRARDEEGYGCEACADPKARGAPLRSAPRA